MLWKTGPRPSFIMASSLCRLMSVVWEARDGVLRAETSLEDEISGCVWKEWFYISMTSRDREVTFYTQMSYKQTGRGYKT